MNTARRVALAAGLAVSAAAHAQTDFSWAAPVDGRWLTPANWTPQGIPGELSPLDSATLGLSGAYTVEVSANHAVDVLTVTNPDARLDILANRTFAVRTMGVSEGEILLSGTGAGSPTTLTIGSNGFLTGRVAMISGTSGDVRRTRIAGPDDPDHPAIISPDAVIYGRGSLTGHLHSLGTIETHVSSHHLAVDGTLTMSDGASITAHGGRIIGAGTISGGSITIREGARMLESLSISNAAVHFEPGSQLLGSTTIGGSVLSGFISIATSHSLILEAGNEYNGTILVNDLSNSFGGTALVLANGAEVGGTVVLNRPLGGAELVASREVGEFGAIAPGAVVIGQGQIRGHVLNQGTIIPDDRIDVINGILGQSATGVIDVSAGELRGSGTINGGLIIVGPEGALLGTGMIKNASIDFESGGRVQGRTIQDSVITGDVTVNAVRFGPGNTFDCTIFVTESPGASPGQPTLELADGGWVSGPVELHTESDNPIRARLMGPAFDYQLGWIHQDAVIYGSGRIFRYLANHGTIIAEGDGNIIEIDTAIPLVSTGTVRAVNGGKLRILSGLDGGTLETDSSARVRTSTNAIENTTFEGTLVTQAGALLTIGHGNTYNGEIVIHDRAGDGNAHLDLIDGATLGGLVTLNAPGSAVTRVQLLGPSAPGTSATIAEDAVVRGVGRLVGSIVNHGVIGPESGDQYIDINTVAPLVSTGTLRAVGGGRLRIHSGMSGGSLHADSDSRVTTGAAGVSGATISGTLVIPAGDEITLGPDNAYDAEFILHDSISLVSANLNLLEDTSLGGVVALNAPPTAVTRALLNGPDGEDESASVGPDALVRGSGRITGHVSAFEGTLAPGSDTARGVVGLAHTGAITFTDTATLKLRADGAQPGQFDRVTNDDHLLLGGTLSVTVGDGATLDDDTPLPLISGGSISGEFDTVTYNGPIGPGRVPRIFYEPDAVSLALVCEADFAHPLGVLDIFDILTFLALFDQQHPAADLAEPFGTFDVFDILTFLDLFEQGCP